MAAKYTQITDARILEWADAHRERTGKWPTVWSGPVVGAPTQDWSAIDGCLEFGGYGLPGRSSLAKLMAKHRGVGRRYAKPRLTIKEILRWADAYQRRAGDWPTKRSGPVQGVRGESWSGIDTACRKDQRGLTDQASLARLIAKHRGTIHPDTKRIYTINEILRWADAYHARHGDWPVARSGAIDGAPEESWRKVDKALVEGMRGITSRGSLAKLLAERRGKRHPHHLSRLSVTQILKWADAHRARRGDWPSVRSGPVPGVPGETWSRIHGSLLHGRRGLPEGGSLAKLLAEHRGRRNRRGMPKLTLGKILEWADAHRERNGEWPTKTSGAVHGQKHETWHAIDSVMTVAGRGLRTRGTLSQLLAKHRNVSRGWERVRLSVSGILEWADAHFARTGEWPNRNTGSVPEAPDEVWSTLDTTLRVGGRGLPGDSSLSDILRDQRDVARRGRRTKLTETRVLKWADAHHARTGKWPTTASGPIHGAKGEIWSTINQALRLGLRGLRRPSSLRELLVKHRGIDREGRLTIKQILAWADDQHAHTGEWPLPTSGPIRGTENETWQRIDHGLRYGSRGLKGGTSLSRLLMKNRGVRRLSDRPLMTVEQILAWADAHRSRTGEWPIASSGRIPNSDGDTWYSVQGALNKGCRGLPEGMTLAQVLNEHRDVPNPKRAANLSIKLILLWADAHHRRTGEWPQQSSGPIHGVTDPRDWLGVERALVTGCRGLRGGATLAKLLDKHRDVRNKGDLPALTVQQILKWADSHHKHTGRWPRMHTGAIPGVPGETWQKIDSCLHRGARGLRGGTSLAFFLEEHRGVRHHMYPPKLTTKQILGWVDAYYKIWKRWPDAKSGPIEDGPGETWRTVDTALYLGRRGFPAGSSLARFLDRHRR